MAYLPSNQWRFDEAGGDIVYDALGQVNGTLSNATRVSPGYTGIGAVHIDGSNSSYVDFTNRVGQFGVADFTIALWIKTSDTLAVYDLIGNRTSGSHDSFVSLRMAGGTGVAAAEVDENSDGKNYVGVTSDVGGLNDGNWHHIAVVRQRQTLSLYVDGKLAGSASATGVAAIGNGNPLKLGRSLIGVVPRFAPNAVFDDVRVYDVALDEHGVAGILTWRLPDELRLILATGLLDSGDTGYITGGNSSFLVVEGDGGLSALSEEKNKAAHFSYTVSGQNLYIAANGKYLQIGSDGRVKASGASPGDAAAFYIYLAENGTAVLSTVKRQVWRLGDDLKIRVVTPTRLDLSNEFGIHLDTVELPVLLQRRNVAVPETLTPCDEAWAGFVWQLTGGLFLSLGLGPFIASGRAKIGILSLLRANPTVWRAIQTALTTLQNDPRAVNAVAFTVIGVVWRAGLLWSVVKFALTSAGWWVAFRVVAKILELALAPELEAVELLASFVIWSAQTIQAGVKVSQACRNVEDCGTTEPIADAKPA